MHYAYMNDVEICVLTLHMLQEIIYPKCLVHLPQN